MRRKHEVIASHHISVWDDGPGGCIDRYTVVDLDSGPYCNPGNVEYLGMSEDPYVGVGLTGEMPLDAVAYRGRGGAFRRRVAFDQLPVECQRCALDWLSS